MYGNVDKLFLDANKTQVMSTVKSQLKSVDVKKSTKQCVRGDSCCEEVLQLTNLVLVCNTILVFVHIFCYIG